MEVVKNKCQRVAGSKQFQIPPKHQVASSPPSDLTGTGPEDTLSSATWSWVWEGSAVSLGEHSIRHSNNLTSQMGDGYCVTPRSASKPRHLVQPPGLCGNSQKALSFPFNAPVQWFPNGPGPSCLVCDLTSCVFAPSHTLQNLEI